MYSHIASSLEPVLAAYISMVVYTPISRKLSGMEKTNETISVLTGSSFELIFVEAYQKNKTLKMPESATKLMMSNIG